MSLVNFLWKLEKLILSNERQKLDTEKHWIDSFWKDMKRTPTMRVQRSLYDSCASGQEAMRQSGAKNEIDMTQNSDHLGEDI